MKDKKFITIANVFQKILKVSNRKPHKIWIDKGSEFYNRSVKSWLEKNAIEMYSTHNEGKIVIARRFIRTLKNEIYKYMASISKNAYIDKLHDIVNKYNNAYHRTIKNQTCILTLVKKLMIEIINLKLVILLEYQNIKIFPQKAMFQIGLKKFFCD